MKDSHHIPRGQANPFIESVVHALIWLGYQLGKIGSPRLEQVKSSIGRYAVHHNVLGVDSLGFDCIEAVADSPGGVPDDRDDRYSRQSRRPRLD